MCIYTENILVQSNLPVLRLFHMWLQVPKAGSFGGRTNVTPVDSLTPHS